MHQLLPLLLILLLLLPWFEKEERTRRGSVKKVRAVGDILVNPSLLLHSSSCSLDLTRNRAEEEAWGGRELLLPTSALFTSSSCSRSKEPPPHPSFSWGDHLSQSHEWASADLALGDTGYSAVPEGQGSSSSFPPIPTPVSGHMQYILLLQFTS